MTTRASAYEFEAFPELEDEADGEFGRDLERDFEGAFEGELEGEFEAELEAELEGDAESEAFFRSLAGLARRAASHPGLRRVGLAAARSALGSLGSIGGASGTGGAALGTAAGAGLGSYLSGRLPQAEDEFELEAGYEEEDEFEGELEMGVSPLRRTYEGALMEHLGHMAKDAESEAEAEAFIGALIPLAARLIPRVAPAIMRAAPQLIRGAANVARTLRRSPSTRPLVRTLPSIVQRTTQDLARQAARGGAITPQRAVRTLARQTQRTLVSPRRCVHAYRASRASDRRFHRAAARTSR